MDEIQSMNKTHLLYPKYVCKFLLAVCMCTEAASYENMPWWFHSVGDLQVAQGLLVLVLSAKSLINYACYQLTTNSKLGISVWSFNYFFRKRIALLMVQSSKLTSVLSEEEWSEGISNLIRQERKFDFKFVLLAVWAQLISFLPPFLLVLVWYPDRLTME